MKWITWIVGYVTVLATCHFLGTDYGIAAVGGWVLSQNIEV